jgi:uncharacterized protein YndB with AHSA1/START domain
MAEIRVVAERTIAAPTDRVYGYLADYQQHHPRILPPAFSDLRVEAGGVGAGTVITFQITAGGRTRAYRMQVAEPEPGRVLTETDLGSSLVTTFTVTPEGDASRVRIASRWEGAGGIGGFFERLFAPRVLRRLYADELARLDAYAREQPPT